MAMAVSANRFLDIDELGEAIGWDLDFRQLDRGRFEGSAEVIAGPDVAVMHVRFNRAFHQRGTCLEGMRTYGLLEREVGSINWCGANRQVDEVLDFNASSGFDGTTPSNHHGYTFSISERCLRQTAEGLDLDPERIGRGNTDRPSASQLIRRTAELRQVFNRLFSVDRTAGLVNGLRDKDLSAMLATEVLRRQWEPPVKGTSLRPATRVRVCSRAVEFIDAHASDSVSIADVCNAAGTSFSTLERAFRDQFGITPKRYQTNRRLIGVRRDLRNGDRRPIYEIAYDWGFWHLGQFARDYKTLFGELPSQTRSMSE